MSRFLKKYLLLVALIATVLLSLWLTRKSWLPAIGNLFKAQPVVIDNSPILIREINELAQLCTITTHDEVVVDSVDDKLLKSYGDAVSGMVNAFQMKGAGKKLVIIARGKVIAGVDLKKITPERLVMHKDSVTVRLPPAEILDVIMNPSDIEVFVETGVWHDDAVKAVKIKARDRMLQRALQQQVLQKASERSRLLLGNFLKGVGFKYVLVLPEKN